MISNEGCSVIFFDVGGTLLEVSPSVGHVYATACAERGVVVAPADVQRAFDRAWVTLSEDVPPGADRYRLFPGGEQGWWEKVSSYAFELCGVPDQGRPPVDELRAVFSRREAWRLFPETRDVLADLKRRGYRLGVLSNWDSRLPALLDTLDLHGMFEAVIYSAAAGYEKPHPAIFAAALDAMKVKAPCAAHIGDRLNEDYEGATASGLRALLVRRDGSSDGIRGDVVANLREAARRIVS